MTLMSMERVLFVQYASKILGLFISVQKLWPKLVVLKLQFLKLFSIFLFKTKVTVNVPRSSGVT